jgi:hypothetical protein
LLIRGNGKLGQAIHLWSLAAVKTCPGRSAICERWCYAGSNHFLLPSVQERLKWNLAQTRRGDFVARMVSEITRKGVLVIRIHVSGDFGSADYAEKWLEIMKQCPQVRYYAYTRSYRVPDIAAVLEEMAQLECCRLWYSIDAETGMPLHVPVGVRLAYLQVNDDTPELCDLYFRVRRLRKERRHRIGLTLICPHEMAHGQDRGVTCGSCQYCFK